MKKQDALSKSFDFIFAELKKAEAKFPGWPEDVVHGAAILAEEAGETVQAALDYYYHRCESKEKMIKEAAQAGAMALRFLTAIIEKEEVNDE